MWKSKRKYKIGDVVGHLVTKDETKHATLVDARGTIHRVSRDIVDTIRAAEERSPANGRPPLFPDCETSTHAITLPKSYWAKLQAPYSRSIGDLIEGRKR